MQPPILPPTQMQPPMLPPTQMQQQNQYPYKPIPEVQEPQNEYEYKPIPEGQGQEQGQIDSIFGNFGLS
jgi:hypothetical protein